MKDKITYFGRIYCTLKSLLTGMSVTLKEFFTPKVTEAFTFMSLP